MDYVISKRQNRMRTRISTKLDHVMKMVYVTEYYSDGKTKLFSYSFDSFKNNPAVDISKFSYDIGGGI